MGPQQAVARPPRRLGGVRGRVGEHALAAAPEGRCQDPAPLVRPGGEADAAAELHSRVQPPRQLVPPGARRRRRRRAPRPQLPPPPQIRGGARRRRAVVVEGGEAAAPGGGQGAQGGGRGGDGDGGRPRIEEASAGGRRQGGAPGPRPVVEGGGRAAAADLHDAVAQGEGGGLPGHEGHQAAPASQEEVQAGREGSQFRLPRNVALGCDQKQVRSAREEVYQEAEAQGPERDGDGQRLRLIHRENLECDAGRGQQQEKNLASRFGEKRCKERREAVEAEAESRRTFLGLEKKPQKKQSFRCWRGVAKVPRCSFDSILYIWVAMGSRLLFILFHFLSFLVAFGGLHGGDVPSISMRGGGGLCIVLGYQTFGV